MTLVRPEDYWSVDDEYAASYREDVAVGRKTAAELSVVVVSIARTAMPFLSNTLALVEELKEGFRDFQWYVYENDSADDTAAALDQFAATRPWFHVRHETLGVADTRGFEPDRTVRLAMARNQCHDYVLRHAADTHYTIVLDVDPHRGFSVDGVFSSIYHLGALASSYRPAGAMASYSLWRWEEQNKVAHYDAYAARLNWWRDRRNEIGMAWFSMLLPPVGSPPFPLNSAFGGLCVYRTQAYLAAGPNPYQGGDCEHVALHKRIAKAGWQLYLNPGCRYVAFWQ